MAATIRLSLVISPVGRVHISLNLKYKGGKIFILGIHYSFLVEIVQAEGIVGLGCGTGAAEKSGTPVF